MQTNHCICEKLTQKINQHEKIIAQLVEMIAHVNKDMQKMISIQTSVKEKQEEKCFASII